MAFVETSTGQLYYEILDVTPPWIGSPETIIFHHGVAGHPAIFTDWLGVLAKRYRIVRFDTRGHARSANSDKRYQWSFNGLVNDLLHVADAAEAQRFHFVGESIGGTVGIACAFSQSKRLLSLTLSNASAKGGLLGNVNIWREMVKTASQRKWAMQMMEWRFHLDALSAESFDWYLDLHENVDMDVCLDLADLLLEADFTDKLGNIQTPTLLLSPDDSPFIPARIMVQMCEKIPGSEIQVFAHSRHGLPLSHGKQCAKVLLEFLNRRT